ncbi:hypothetical protein [Embleya sp. NPDC020886]|uniref:hypothetical protein n=1 Tax=Embleya sp. NPDC020886 TaxID=3363980 RepID=UPI00378FDD34
MLLAGAIAQGAIEQGRADAVFDDHATEISGFRRLADERLKRRPETPDYTYVFRTMLALEGSAIWSEAIDELSDAFLMVACPHCEAEVTIAIGEYGYYSACRDWDLGDEDRRPLRPTRPQDLEGLGKRLYDVAARDEQEALALGITHIFGHAQCGACDEYFDIADTYQAQHSEH